MSLLFLAAVMIRGGVPPIQRNTNAKGELIVATILRHTSATVKHILPLLQRNTSAKS